MSSAIDAFARELGFDFDDFQLRAMTALAQGRSVLVAAPTGAGKTVVGAFACQDAINRGGRAFYTTPIKALSNQKYRELAERHGYDAVGLLTGDRSVNGEAPVVVMTTEVLRNMIYEASPALDGLTHVVLDEVHYLADRSRGAVWEEVIIQLPRTVQLSALSATVSNAETFGRWLDQVRHGCEVVVEERRPIPLRHHYFVNGTVHDTFKTARKGGGDAQHRARAAQALAGVPNPDVVMLERRARQQGRVTKRGKRIPQGPRLRWPSRPEVVDELARRQWLPAILFVFSRSGCDKAIEQLRHAGVRLTSPHERDEIAAIVDTMVAELPRDDLDVLGFDHWRAGLVDGLAAHHAGMVPAFKECVEVLFQRGLLKLVVATETLALGINMPARTVVLERLEKWNGDAHVMLTPGEYTQLTGRAGRRGIDRVGHAVVLHQRDISFTTVAGLVGTRSYPLASSFTPSYNMAVNLLRHHDLRHAEALLGSSFAQFEADAGVARRADRLRELEDGIAGYATHLACDAGDWDAYWRLRREQSAREKQHARSRRRRHAEQVGDAIAGLRPGDVLRDPTEGAAIAVVGVHVSRAGTPLAHVVSDAGALSRVGPREFTEAPEVIDRVRLPRSGNPRQREYRREVGRQLAAVDVPEAAPAVEPERDDADEQRAIDEIRAQVRDHPCHGCPDRAEHERWQYRSDELIDEATGLRSEITRATGSLVRKFARIRAVLDELDYLDQTPAPTEHGLRLARIYSDVDLLIAETLRHGLLDGLDAAELAGVAALFVFEARMPDAPPAPRLATARLATTVDRVGDLAERLRQREQAEGITPIRELDAAFISAAWHWASGHDLDTALGNLELTGGDFVRNVKQIIDLLGQLRHAGNPAVADTARVAIDVMRRGIVDA